MTQLYTLTQVAAIAESEKITSAVQPRGMTKTDAAAYCGCGSLAAFDDWIRRGIVPGPIPGTRRWDRKADAHHFVGQRLSS